MTQSTGALSVLVAALLLALIGPPGINGDIQIHWSSTQRNAAESILGEVFVPEGSNDSIIGSFTLSRMSSGPEYQTLYFPSVTGPLVAYNETGGNDSMLYGAIIAGYVPTLIPYRYHEDWITAMVEQYQPKALVLLAARTIQQLESLNHAFDMRHITVPVVAVVYSPPADSTQYLRLLRAIQLFPTGLNVTISSGVSNPWWSVRFTVWPILFTLVLAPWSLINGVIAVWTMKKQQTLNIAFLCLVLETLSSLVRFSWAIDPYAARFIPTAVLEVLYTASFPMSLGSLVLLALFWQEITLARVQSLSALQSAMRIPGAIATVIMVILETVSSSIRAALGWAGSTPLIIAGFAVYFVVGLVVTVHFIFVSVRVIRFLKQREKYNAKDQLLVQILARILGSTVGLLFLLVFFIFYFLSLFYAPEKTYYLLFFIHACADWISSVQVFSVWRSVIKVEAPPHAHSTSNRSFSSEILSVGSTSL